MASRSVQADATKRKPGPITEAEKAKLRQLMAEGKSIADIARELGVGTSTVSRVKKREGLTSTPAHDNSAGTQAYKRDAAKKRAERVAVLDELHALRSEMVLKVMRGEAKYKTLVKIPGGGQITEQLSYIPAADWRSEVYALGTLATTIDRADDRADDGGLARAQSMLQMVLQAAAKGSFSVPAEEAVFED